MIKIKTLTFSSTTTSVANDGFVTQAEQSSPLNPKPWSHKHDVDWIAPFVVDPSDKGYSRRVAHKGCPKGTYKTVTSTAIQCNDSLSVWGHHTQQRQLIPRTLPVQGLGFLLHRSGYLIPLLP
eukprot:c8611_g1_i1.p1 GENE.c8611_g1_i1~~c8611_g1_i1.p1  ORF type:complete len:123 (-),score=17.71 c8611_g1_i1:981-1349(-)